MKFEDWLSGFLDGRGIFYVKPIKRRYKSKKTKKMRSRMYTQIGLKISSKKPEILHYIMNNLNMGYITIDGDVHTFWITKTDHLKKLIDKIESRVRFAGGIDDIKAVIESRL